MGDLRSAVDRTVEASDRIERVDDALVEAARKLADRIDEATETGSGPDVTKALYLMPHLINVLREMYATPASRRSAGLDGKEAGGKLRSLKDAQEKRGQQKKPA